jgi:hypothetical protein
MVSNRYRNRENAIANTQLVEELNQQIRKNGTMAIW